MKTYKHPTLGRLAKEITGGYYGAEGLGGVYTAHQLLSLGFVEETREDDTPEWFKSFIATLWNDYSDTLFEQPHNVLYSLYLKHVHTQPTQGVDIPRIARGIVANIDTPTSGKVALQGKIEDILSYYL